MALKLHNVTTNNMLSSNVNELSYFQIYAYLKKYMQKDYLLIVRATFTTVEHDTFKFKVSKNQ